MPGLDTDMVVHNFPLRPECTPVKQKLRRMKIPPANRKLQAIWDPTFDRDEGVVFTRNPRVADQVK